MNMRTIKSELSTDIVYHEEEQYTEKQLIETSYFAARDYIIHETGIYKLAKSNPAKDKKANYYWIKITDYYIYPVQILSTVDLEGDNNDANKDINSMYVNVAFKNIRNEKKILSIPLDQFSDLKSSKLKKAGYLLPYSDNQQLKEIQKAVSTVLATAQSPYKRLDGKIIDDENQLIDCLPAYTKRGWIVDSLIHIRESHPQFVGVSKTRTKRVGNASIQITVFQELIKSSRLASIFISVAFASYTKGLIRKTANFSPIYNIFGEKGKGKSTLEAMIASIEGAPNREYGLIRDSKTTFPGLEELLASYTNGFFVIDEIDDMFRGSASDAISKLMTIANNGGRSKYDKDTEVSEGKMWNSIFFTTSNKSLYELTRGDMKQSAIDSRIFEFDVEDPEINIFGINLEEGRGDVVEWWLNQLDQNFGHLYPLIIDYIVKHVDELRTNIYAYEGELINDPNYKIIHDERRTIQTIALSKIGADIVGAILGEEYGMICHEAIDIHKSRFSNKDIPQFDVNEKHWDNMDVLKLMINANKASFVWETYAYSDDDSSNRVAAQKSEAKRYSDMAQSKGNVLGIIHLNSPMETPNDFDGYVILNTMGDEHLRRSFKLEITELVASAKKLELYDTKRVRGAKQLLLGSTSTREKTFILKNRPVVIETESEEAKNALLDEAFINNSIDSKADLEEIIKYAHSNVDTVVDGEPLELDDDFVPF